MDLDEAIRSRRMCRNFTPEPVPGELIDRILDRARRAPSAGHTQGWAFVVLDQPPDLRRFWDVMADEEWRADPTLPGLMRAPVAIVPLCSPARYAARYSEPDKIASGLNDPGSWPVAYWTVDVSFAVMLLLLGAVAEGLGALFYGRREDQYSAFKEAFSVPAEWQPIGALAIGWPAVDRGPSGSASRGRLPLEAVVHRGGW